jgi:hypothetical protein
MDDKIEDEFKMEFNESSEDEYEKILDKDIEENLGLNIYVDKLEEINELTEDKIEKMEKKEIWEHQNYHISKLKAYIVSLEKEKDDLIENFKNTTDILLDTIKQKEFESHGIRPITAQIVNEMKNVNMNSYNLINSVRDKNNSNSYNNSNNNIINYNNQYNKKEIDVLKFDDKNAINLNGNNYNNEINYNYNYNYNIDLNGFNNNNSNNTELYERCANCKKEILKVKIIMHSLDCLRKNRTCKACQIIIPENMMKDHLDEWKSVDVYNKIN